MSELLLKVTASKLIAEDLRPAELLIYDDQIVFHSNVGLVGGEESIINYDQIAEVNQFKGFLTSRLEIINKGGADDISIEKVPNDLATQAKELIEERARAWSEEHGTPEPPPNTSTAEG
jgi:hypothetical protein